MSDPEGNVEFKAGGKTFTAIFGFRAMKAVEGHFNLPFFRAIQKVMPQVAAEDLGDKARLAEASADIRFEDLGSLFQFSLLKFHRELSDDEIEDMVDDLGLSKISEIIGNALAAALTEQEGEGSNANPPKPARGRKTG